jgi:Rod binding domain-containing protein
MSGAFALPAPGLTPLDVMMTSMPAKPALTGDKTKLKAAARDFEAVFLNSMFQEMYTDIGGEGPFGGNGSTGVWRSFLTNAYAKQLAKVGGVGIADQVYRSLLAHQEHAS